MIKKILFNIAAVAAVCFAATSCSSDEDPILNGGGLEAADAEITLSFNDGGESRAARPVYSSEADNDVNKVEIALLVNNKAENEAEDNWVTAKDVTMSICGEKSTTGSVQIEWNAVKDGSGNAKETLKLKGLAGGKSYKVVAYGYNKETPTTTISATSYPFSAAVNVKEESKSNETKFYADYENVEEVFAGEKSFSAGENGKVASKVTVTMKRQVAGFLGYFKNIPVQHTDQSGELKDVTGVRVVASGYAVDYAFGSDDFEVNSKSTLREGDIVVYEKMVDPNWKKVNGLYEFQQTVSNVTIAPNSWLAGRFLVPFNKDKENNKQTFEIQLIGGENNDVLHTWSVKCFNYTESTNCFDVCRNHFYMIGKKYKNNPGEDDDKPDDPIDLSDDGEIEISLNDAWDIIHDLELE